MKKTNIHIKFNGDSPFWNTAQSRRDLAMCRAINVLAKTVDELVEEVTTLKEELLRMQNVEKG